MPFRHLTPTAVARCDVYAGCKVGT